MRHLILLAFAMSGCNNTECAPGTIAKNGKCEPADVTTSGAQCGPFTELQGDKCVPMFPPTMCDPSTTTADTDPATGVTTCIGTGGGGCSAPFACPTPSSGTQQTICGQLYDLETNQPFAAPQATGAKCSAATANGPCAIGIQAYDAIAFGMNPQTAQPLTNGGVEIDDCGRYRVKDIDVPSGLFIGLGIDDANMSNMGPMGVTNTTGVATPKAAGMATKDLEAWVVKASTTTSWQNTGGPPLSGGIYVAIFRQHKLGNGDPLVNQAGVTITKMGSTSPANDYYFVSSEANHTNIDAAAVMTGVNGTGLFTNASVNDSLAYSGVGGIADTVNCRWEAHAAASLPFIVFLQVYRPQNQIGKTCGQ